MEGAQKKKSMKSESRTYFLGFSERGAFDKVAEAVDDQIRLNTKGLLQKETHTVNDCHLDARSRPAYLGKEEGRGFYQSAFDILPSELTSLVACHG